MKAQFEEKSVAAKKSASLTAIPHDGVHNHDNDPGCLKFRFWRGSNNEQQENQRTCFFISQRHTSQLAYNFN